MPAIHLQAFPPPLPTGEVLEARTFRIIKWEIGWLGKRMSKGKIFKSMDRLYDSSEGGVADGWWGMEKRRPKVLGRTQRRSFLGFPPVLNYRAGRLRLPRGTILIRKLGESLRAIRTIVEKRNRDHSKARGPGGNIGDVRIARR